MKRRLRKYFRRANGVLMIRDDNGRVRVATLHESAEQSARPRWWPERPLMAKRKKLPTRLNQRAER